MSATSPAEIRRLLEGSSRHFRGPLRKGSGTGLFVKALAGDRLAQLLAEAEGLEALAATGCIRVPEIYLCEIVDDRACLVTEYLELTGAGKDTQAALGRNLACVHRNLGPQWGWASDNFLGDSPQENAPEPDWTGFFFRRRLAPPMRALDEPFAGWQDATFQALAATMEGHDPPRSLIHGDLWAGNAGTLPDGTPVVFDPAVHHADRECDLAMTRLFGGFDPAFYSAYEKAWPLPAGHRQREPWYRLYHLLNHARLFGGGYRGQSLDLLERLAGPAR